MKTTYSSKMTNVTKDDANKSSNGIRESLLNNNFKDLIKKNPLETGLNKVLILKIIIGYIGQ